MAHFASATPLPHLPDLHRIALGNWPTPVRSMLSLGQELGLELWLKCDHLSNPDFGGNKVRKLELLLGDAAARGSRSIVTVGALGSNQVTATAMFAPAIGAHAAAVAYARPLTPWGRANVATWRHFGIAVRHIASPSEVPAAMESLERTLPGPVYAIPAGGSSPIGNLGHVAAALELARQIAARELPEPDRIVVACGTGGTLAGLALGGAIAGWRCQLLGVAGEDAPAMVTNIERQIGAMLRLVGEPGRQSWRQRRPQIEVVTMPATAGVISPEIQAAMDLVYAHERVRLEPIYTAPTFAWLLQHARDLHGTRLLVWNTAHASGPSNVRAQRTT